MTIDEIVDEIDIEAFEGEGRKPKARFYRFRVDKKQLRTEHPELTGEAILKLAGKLPPENYLLFQVFKDGRSEPVTLTEVVDLRAPGVEKFRTLPRDQTEG